MRRPPLTLFKLVWLRGWRSTTQNKGLRWSWINVNLSSRGPYIYLKTWKQMHLDYHYWALSYSAVDLSWCKNLKVQRKWQILQWFCLYRCRLGFWHRASLNLVFDNKRAALSLESRGPREEATVQLIKSELESYFTHSIPGFVLMASAVWSPSLFSSSSKSGSCRDDSDIEALFHRLLSFEFEDIDHLGAEI